MTAWIIGGSVSAHSSAVNSCRHDHVLAYKTCMDASNTGSVIGVGLLIVLFFIGFVVLSLIWFMTRPKRTHEAATSN
jgi:hypothetical protein